MRQDVDRRVGEEFDVVGAARQRGFDVAGIQDVEEIQHVLTIWSLGHSPTCLCSIPRLRPDPL
jgi:hypothetical protein